METSHHVDANPFFVLVHFHLEHSQVNKMTNFWILFVFIMLLSSGRCVKLMVPHGLLQKYWQNEFSLLANYTVHCPETSIGGYSLVFDSNITQVLHEFRHDCIHSCEEVRLTGNCYVIYSKSPENKGVLQLCQDELLYFDTNISLTLALTDVNSSKQAIVHESERTRNESIWTFTKVQPMFTLAAL